MAIPFLAHLHDPSSEQRQQQQDAAALLPFDPNAHSPNEELSHHRHFHHHHHHQQLRDQILDGAMEMEDVGGAGGEAPAGSPCEGALATAAAAAAAAPASAAAVSRDTSAAPPWLASFLAAPYFVPCSLHAALHKSERNFFCIDCYSSATHGSDSSISSSSFNGSHSGSSSPRSSLCSVCVARAHHGHAVLQVRKSSYHDAVRVADIGRLIDVTAIQVYVINGAKIVFLNPRPQARPLKGAPYHCARCQRNLLDAGGHFCSVACKLEVVLLCSSSSNGGSGSNGSGSSGGSRTGIGDGARTPRQLLQLKARLLPPQMPSLPGLQQQASKLGATAAPSSPKKIVIKKLKAPPPAAAAGVSAPPGAAAEVAEKGKEEVHFHGPEHASAAGVHSNSRFEVEEDDDDLETVWLKQEAADALVKNIVAPQPPLHPKLLLKRKFQQQMQMQQMQQQQMQMQQRDDVSRKQHEVDQQQQQQQQKQHGQQMKTLPKLQLPPLLIEDKDESSSDLSGVEADRCGNGEGSGEEEEMSQAKKRVRRMKEVYMQNGEREGGQTDTFPSLISHGDEGPAAVSNRPAQMTSTDTAQHLFNSPSSPLVGATEGGFTPGPPSPTFSSTSSPWSWRSPRHRRKGMPLRAHLV